MSEARRQGNIAADLLLQEFGLEKSIEMHSSVDKNGMAIPWYSYPAIEFLSQMDFSEKKIFEFGSGNSTLWWGARAKNICSVEHNPEWYNIIAPKMPANVKLLLAQEESKYLDVLDGKYDVVVIDAIWRDKCAERTLENISDTGIIIIDDAQRVQKFAAYQRAMKILQNDPRFIEIDFSGFSPIVSYTKITTLFISRKINLKRKQLKSPEFCIGNLKDEHE